MLLGQITAEFRLDPAPVAHHTHIPERYARLRHAPGAGVHPHKDDARLFAREPLQIGPLPVPGIVQRVVDMARASELERIDIAPELAGQARDGILGAGAFLRHVTKADGTTPSLAGIGAEP